MISKGERGKGLRGKKVKWIKDKGSGVKGLFNTPSVSKISF